MEPVEKLEKALRKHLGAEAGEVVQAIVDYTESVIMANRVNFTDPANRVLGEAAKSGPSMQEALQGINERLSAVERELAQPPEELPAPGQAGTPGRSTVETKTPETPDPVNESQAQDPVGINPNPTEEEKK